METSLDYLVVVGILNSNNVCPWKRKAERELSQTDKGRETQSLRWKDGGRDWSDVAASQGMLAASRS